jgi:two-component system chemotaxis response regulator CheB
MSSATPLTVAEAAAREEEKLAGTPIEGNDGAADQNDGGLASGPSEASNTVRPGGPRPRHLILVACSAGGLPALQRLFKQLPPDLDAAIVVTQHLPPWHRTRLADILSRVSRLPVSLARAGERLRNARVYVAPPGYHHVVVSGGRIHYQPQPRDAPRGVSADPLFVSGAKDFGAATIGVVLSGANRNGAAGVRAIRAVGGKAVAQAPQDAEYATMPRAALQAGVNFCGSVEDIAHYLAAICRR